MSQREELNALARRKAVLLARIADRRDRCAEAMAELAPHLAMADTVISGVKQLTSTTSRLGLPFGLGSAAKIVGGMLPGLFGKTPQAGGRRGDDRL